MRFIGIIPSRYASTRFPGKPLVDICGKPMIVRVYEQVKKALDIAVVATDDSRIYDAVKAYGGEVVMTATTHRCGTERCLEAYHILCNTLLAGQDHSEDVVINIQGDEPFIQPSQIEAICSCFPTDIATLAKPFTADDSIHDLENPNTPKIIFSQEDKHAVYFSRSVIPYLRGIDKSEWINKSVTSDHPIFHRHIGMYAYRADVLEKITQLPPSPLEMAESLEQLRWLENGYTIKVAVCDTYSMGIDTPEDLENALKFIKIDQ